MKTRSTIIATIMFCLTTTSAYAISDQVRAMCREAEQLINSGRFGTAIKLLKKAEKIEPTAAEVHGYLGMAYQNSAKTQKAVPEYLKALELNPGMSFININLGTCYMNLGQPRKAVPYFQRYLQDNPNAPNRAQVEAYIQQSGVRQNQNNLRTVVERGQALLNRGQVNQAINAFQQAVAINPNFPPAYFYLGYAFAKSGNHQKAIEEFKRSYQLDPTQKEAIINIGSNYQSLGDISSAITWYQKYVDENPNSSKSREIVGRINGLKKQAQESGSKTRPTAQNQWQTNNQNDYFGSATGGGKAFRWPSNFIPIRVFIADGRGVNGYRPGFQKILMNAFSKWATASQNKLMFSLAPNSSSANIVCSWTDNPNQITEQGRAVEGGLTKLSGQALPGSADISITGARVLILTRSRTTGAELSDDEMMKICLHEAGHALGINGHSNNNKDIMFFSESPSMWPALTKRDKATIRRLYQAYPIR